MRIESKVGKAKAENQQVFDFLTDFRNFENLIPQDKVQNFKAEQNQCEFEMPMIGKTGMQIQEQQPVKEIKITAIDGSQFNFTLWIQMKPVENQSETHIKVTIDPALNPMMQMMVKKPLKEFVDKLVDQMANFKFDPS